MEEEGDTQVIVRRATEADRPAVTQVIAKGKLAPASDAGEPSRTLVAEIAGHLIGIAELRMFGGAALLRAAWVGEEGRGRGVGRRLVEAILTEAALEGADTVYLFTQGAHRFFGRFGFVVVSDEEVPSFIRRWAEANGGVPQESTSMQLTLI